MIQLLHWLKQNSKKAVLALCFIAFIQDAFTQQVENRGCPISYFRNNGNGQAVTVFASNINPNSIYYQSALNTGNQGNLTFKWSTNIVNPPVIKKTWVTSTSGVTTQNWVFGNNTTGSPFNPPGVPDGSDVKYTFYNNNLPTAGRITLELADPFDGSIINTCSYPLSSGGSSTGLLTYFAVAAPSGFKYNVSSALTAFGTPGNSEMPTINTGGGAIHYQLQTNVNGFSVDSTTGVIGWDNTIPVGTHNLTIKASNGIQLDATTDYMLAVTDNGISSGNSGGLESKSLGNALAERIFNTQIQNIPAAFNYATAEKIENSSSLRNSSNNIRNLLPDQQQIGNNVIGFITSPTDIISFTNAKDVVSVDYVQNGINKAVAFCTQTNSGVYTHTKPVCDRLKGSELLAIDTISSGSYRFLRYHLKPASGLTEYATSFSAGFNSNDSRYTLQSEWTTDRYTAQDTMYNFQLWSADAGILNIMLNNVLQKLANDMPVTQIGPIKKPVTYITKAERDGDNQLNLQLTIHNSTSSTAGTIIIAGKTNEQATINAIRNYPVSFKANGISVINIPVKDMAEAEIRLMVNGNQEDFVYSNDGIWNVYKTPATKLTTFTINNDTIQPKATEYRLFRNVQLIATTPDYITVYRMVKGGGMAANLSPYNYLKFTGTGSGTVRIRLVKKSISNYNEQYEYVLPMQTDKKEYSIRLSDFKSSATTNPIKMNDIVIASFTWESTGGNININASLSNVRFAKNATDIIAASGTMKIFPNPASANITLNMASEVAETMNLQLISAANGQVVMQKTISVLKGNNMLNIGLTENIPVGLYLVTMQSATQRFHSKVLKVK
jgi:hypothetical protein